MEHGDDSLKRLFQSEFTKIVAVIARIFGLRHIEIAEDIVSETFLLASETWGIKGMPDNPAAWLYDQLLTINYSPVVALNRAYAIYKLSGPEIALAEAEKLKLDDDHFYYTLLGELYRTIDRKKARSSFERALDLAKTQTEKELINKKIEGL